MQTMIAIAAGGALGAVLRHGVNGAVVALAGVNFPLGIMAVNIIGSLVMGVLTGVFAHFYEPSQTMKAFLTVGVLGGFTTFSSFSLDAVLLWQRGETVQAVFYVAASVLLSIAALVAGMMLVRMVSA